MILGSCARTVPAVFLRPVPVAGACLATPFRELRPDTIGLNQHEFRLCQVEATRRARFFVDVSLALSRPSGARPSTVSGSVGTFRGTSLASREAERTALKPRVPLYRWKFERGDAKPGSGLEPETSCLQDRCSSQLS